MPIGLQRCYYERTCEAHSQTDRPTKPAIFDIAGRPADFLKIAPGPIFNPRGVENRIPHAEIFRFQPLKPYSDRFLKNQNFRKIDFFQKSIIFSIFIGILKPGSIKIERGIKKYFRGLIMRFFGLMGSSFVPGDADRPAMPKESYSHNKNQEFQRSPALLPL